MEPSVFMIVRFPRAQLYFLIEVSLKSAVYERERLQRDHKDTKGTRIATIEEE